MASYSDFIKMQNYLPVYDITADSSDSLWHSFIPTNQFNSLLSQTLTAVSSSDGAKRKSIWLQGTFGTGKSHASSVIKHLLCDEFSEVGFYIEKIENADLRENLRNFRKSKRFFSVVIKGVEGAYDLPRFSLSLQREVKGALVAAGHHNIVVPTNYESAIQYIKEHQRYAQDAIDTDPELKDIASNPGELIDLFERSDSEAYLQFEDSLYKTVGASLPVLKISKWLEEIEEAIEKDHIADGLIIFWDEFTSIMEAISSDRINVLQNIAEISQNKNLFLFLISHRVEEQISSNRSKTDDIRTMSDRFYMVRYSMDEVSTYRIMRHTFEVEDKEEADYLSRRAKEITNSDDLIEYLCEGGVEDERTSILNLFPMHPYSAYLCSKLSDYVGSANRSIVNFMNDEKKGFRKFISEEDVYENHVLLTAEWLWDFFYDSFVANPQCRVFVSNYQNNINRVEGKDAGYVRVYKGILLLNVLSSQFENKGADIIKRVSPNEKSIRGMFVGDPIENQMDEILNFLHDQNVITRDALDEFRIFVSTLNPTEVSNEKKNIAMQFSSAISLLDYNKIEKENIINLFAVGTYLIRKCEPMVVACSDPEYILRNKLKKYMSEKPNQLHVILYVGLTENECNMCRTIVGGLSKEFPNSIHIVPDVVFTDEARDRFIEYVANSEVAKKHNQESMQADGEKAAKALVGKWVTRLKSGTFSLSFKGEQMREGILSNVSSLINKKVSPKVFNMGFESVSRYRTVSPAFHKKGNFPALFQAILEAQNRDELMRFSGGDADVKYIFEENNTLLIDSDCNLTLEAINKKAWVAIICEEVDRCINEAKKNYVDKFSLPEIFASLMNPPFGFFQTRACWATLSFALRKHKSDLFDTKISQPISNEKLRDMVKDVFEMWDAGKSEYSEKHLLRFGSKEESELTKLLFEVFQLDTVEGISEVKSLNNVRWGINEYCKKKTKYPLWTLTYCDNINETRLDIIKQMISVLENDQNPNLNIIKRLYQQIKGEKIDISQIVTNKKNYEEGFVKFVELIEDVKINREWWEELLEEIFRLQSEVAFRKETDVRECVMSFYIGKINPKKTYGIPEGGTPSEVCGRITGGNGSRGASFNEESIRKAKSIVKNAQMPVPLWQQFVLDTIENNPEIAEYIITYFS